MKTIDIECRECNRYIKIEKKTSKYRCPKCGCKEDLVIIDKKEIKKRANR